jgi:hypothetical protein
LYFSLLGSFSDACVTFRASLASESVVKFDGAEKEDASRILRWLRGLQLEVKLKLEAP